MGCCFSESDEREPLLGQTRDGRVKGNYVPNDNYRHVDKPASSARRFRPPESPAEDRDEIKEIQMKRIGISIVDKRLEDHASLFNAQVQRWQQIESAIKEMEGMLPEKNTGKNIHDLFFYIKNILILNQEAFSSVVIKRRFKYCMEIQYDDKLVDHKVAPAFLAFNKANKLIKEILEKGPGIISSIQLVLKDEKNLRREVLVASLGADGPDCLKACMDNIAELRKCVEVMDSIKRETLRRFEKLKAAATPLTHNE